MADEELPPEDNGTGDGGAPPEDQAPGAGANGDELREASFDEAPEPQPHEDEWNPPRTAENGIALDADGFPLNLRLRALYLADAGAAEDESGAVSVEQIESARLELANYDSQYPAIDSGTKKPELEAMAEREGIDLSGASNNEERAAAILAARPARII